MAGLIAPMPDRLAAIVSQFQELLSARRQIAACGPVRAARDSTSLAGQGCSCLFKYKQNAIDAVVASSSAEGLGLPIRHRNKTFPALRRPAAQLLADRFFNPPEAISLYAIDVPNTQIRGADQKTFAS